MFRIIGFSHKVSTSFFNFLDTSKLIMNNIVVCIVSGRCHYKKKGVIIKRKLGFSEWAMGAQAEALVPSTMWYTVF